MRKIIAVSVLGLMLSLATLPALAFGGGWGSSSKQINAGNSAEIDNTISAGAFTGENKIINIASKGGDNDGKNEIKTGDAYSEAGAINVANTNISSGSKQVNVHNHAGLRNNVMAMSDTGLNKIVDVAKKGGDSDGDNKIDTGDAFSRAGVINVVNSNIKRGWMMP